MNTIKYNKSLQGLANVDISNYKRVSGRYIIYEANGKAKEYDFKDNLIFEGEYLNGKGNGKG